MMLTIGFFLFLIGAAAMDSQGIWWYVAAGIMITGLLMVYIGKPKNT